MTNNYPFAQELITDTQGNIRQVILNFEDYQQLLERLEDEALYQAMKTTINETPMSREEVLKALEEERL
jgi:RelB Antitoxin alpha helical domain